MQEIVIFVAAAAQWVHLRLCMNDFKRNDNGTKRKKNDTHFPFYFPHSL